MASNLIQIDYEAMQEIGRAFEQQQESVETVLYRLDEQLEKLESGCWVGENANVFYASMYDEVMPGVDRLRHALCDAADSVLSIIKTCEDAENDAANNIHGDKDAGPGKDAPVKPPATTNYTVKSGDTLWDIAQRHNTTVDELVALNNIPDRDLIYPGQQIIIPGEGGGVAEPAPVKTPPPGKVGVPEGGTTQVVNGQSIQFATPMNPKPKAIPGWCMKFVSDWRQDLTNRRFPAARDLIYTGNEYVANLRYTLNGQSLVGTVHPGHLVVYDAGQLGANDTYGHVSVVMQVHNDHVVVKESSWDGQVDTWRKVPLAKLQQLTMIGHANREKAS